MQHSRALALVAGAVLALASSCASYTVPGRGADMALFKPTNQSEQAIAGILERKPIAPFPAIVAAVRVQAPDYSSYSVRDTAGTGAYSVVTVRDIETEADFARLAALPMVRAVAPFNRLLLPGELNGPEELRRAAAELHADLLLIYTLDTVFRSKEHGGVIALVSLGLLPTKIASVDTTASAILLDTRTGYLYGVAEATESAHGNTNVWFSEATLDNFRRKTERASFDKLLGEVERTWADVVAQYAKPPDVPQGANSAGSG